MLLSFHDGDGELVSVAGSRHAAAEHQPGFPTTAKGEDVKMLYDGTLESCKTKNVLFHTMNLKLCLS